MRPRHLRGSLPEALAAAGAFAAILAATPALAILRDAIPFWGAAKAPQSVRVQFSEMNTGAPAGMSPEAVAGQTRDVGEFTFNGEAHTLWVAPAKNGGFCFLWVGGWGGCHTGAADPLTWNGDLVLPPGVEAPTIANMKPGAVVSGATAQAIVKAHDLAVPTWIAGYVSSRSASDVAITFSDGSTVHPRITWVSAPIRAGFFSYDIPLDLQTKSDHLVTVAALDATGSVVQQQPLH